jgi:uncharacterized membrane protein
MEDDIVVDIERRAAPRNRRASLSARQLARGLAWWSLGLGIAQVLAPRTVSRLIGVPLPRVLTILCGVRGIASGIGILTQDQPEPWIRVRVAGDVLDLATLAGGSLVREAPRARLALATVVAAGVTAADVYCGKLLRERGTRPPPRHVKLSVDVQRPPHEVYRFWRDVANFPRVMPHLESVQVLDEIHSHWVAKGPGGVRLEWDTEIIDDQAGERLAWRSVEGAAIYSAGSVEFHPLGSRATRMRIELLCDSPPGSLSLAIARLFGRDPQFGVRLRLDAFEESREQG